MTGAWLEPEHTVDDSVIVFYNINFMRSFSTQASVRVPTENRHVFLTWEFEAKELLCPHKWLAWGSDGNLQGRSRGWGQLLPDFDFHLPLGFGKTGKRAQTWLIDSWKALLCLHYLHSKPLSGGWLANPEWPGRKCTEFWVRRSTFSLWGLGHISLWFSFVMCKINLSQGWLRVPDEIMYIK